MLWGALQFILKQIITANPHLWPVYLSKVDLADAYMRLWERMEDFLSVAFLKLNKTLATHRWWDSTSPSPWGA